MADYNNIFGGLSNTTQIPLYTKTYSVDEQTLKNLGFNDYKAFIYEQGLIVYCALEKTRWEWREVEVIEPVPGLLDFNYIYPSDAPITFGITYASKEFNFFPLINEPAEPEEPTEVTVQVGATNTIAPGTLASVTNSGTITDLILDFNIPQGIQGEPGLPGEPGEPGLTPNVVNLQDVRNSFTLTAADNNHTFMIPGDGTESVITVPVGLPDKFVAAFCSQDEFQDVRFSPAPGVTINTPVGLKIKGFNLAVCLEQVGSSNIYQLMGNTKV